MSSNLTIPKYNLFSKLKSIDIYNIFLNIVSILLIIATVLLIIQPQKYMDSIIAGLNLFFYSVLPSLLPFLFLSKLLNELGVFNKIGKLLKPITKGIFNCPTITGYAMCMSYVCGYPVGAKIIGELYKSKQISQEEAKKMIALCTTSGPIFVIGAVGVGLLNNFKLGVLIFICHILGSLLTGFIFTRKKIKTETPKGQKSCTYITKDILNSCTQSTISSILTVAVYVSIFYMFIDMAYDLNIIGGGSVLLEKLLSFLKLDPNLSSSITAGFIEMTRGCKELSSSQSSLCKLIFCSGIISFSGLSIILQSLTFLSGTQIRPSYFLLIKLSQFFITCIVGFGLGIILL